MEDIIRRIPVPIRRVIETGSALAVRRNYKLYIVGGALRDYYMSKKPSDVDIVVEGNGMELAGMVAEKLKYPIVRHQKFLTATIKISQDFEVDFSTARREVYKKPAALPDITPSTIYDDLKRRDFTINAIAIDLNRDNYLEVIDPFNGRRDIKNKVIRVLHDQSFIDDPTRAFRAIRYMARFGFRIENNTYTLMREAEARGVFYELTASRIFNEIKLLLSEERPNICMKNLERFNLLKVFSDNIKIGRGIATLLSEIPRINQKIGTTEQWRVCLVALLSELSENERDLMIKKYPFDRQLIKSINQSDRFKTSLENLWKKRKNSELFSELRDFSDEILICGIAGADSREVKSALIKFIKSIKNRPPLLSGNDLKKEGILPGPIYNKILQKVHLLYLDGKIKNRKDAVAWVRARFIRGLQG